MRCSTTTRDTLVAHVRFHELDAGCRRLSRLGEQFNEGIALCPVVVIYKREAWFFANPDALASMKRGLEQAGTGKTHDLGSFAGAANDDNLEAD